ncbi:hypothetical protein HWV62_10347 [Athelia sp. TMB]|nr:hypothetical protein HWV62_10347 [Athelia sp. TMB]
MFALLTSSAHCDLPEKQRPKVGSTGIPIIPAVPAQEPAVAANLSLAARFDTSDSESEDAQDSEVDRDPFDQIDIADDHYFDANGVEIEFSAGAIPTADKSHDQLYQQMDDLRHYDHCILGEEGNPRVEGTGESSGTGDPTIADIVAQMHALGLEEEDDVYEDETAAEEEEGWFPHGSKTECGARNVPSFAALRKKQKQLAQDVGIETKNHTSPLGNEFFMNGPADLFKLDFANPLVRDALELYPDLTCASVSEFWQAGKWIHDSDLSDLTPMWANFDTAPHRHFYVNEIAQLRDGRFGIPLRYGKVGGVEVVEFFEVVFYEATSTFVIRSDAIMQIEARNLTKNMLDLEAEGLPVTFESLPTGANVTAQTSSRLHPVRKIANGRPAFIVRMMPWSDDVSGNRSKQYNPHTNVYLANASLPHQKLQQEYFVRFCSTSPHASSSEQLHAMSKDVGPDRWHSAFDCQLQQEIIFRIITHVLPADNPQQSETCSHIGLKGNQFCRHCDVGGTDKHKETEGGYEAMYSPGTPREVSATVEAIEIQLFTACLGAGEPVKVLQTDTGIKDKTAQYWIDQALLRASELKRQHITDPITKDTRLKDRKLKGDAREAVKTEIALAVQKEVYSWLLQQPEKSYELLELDSPWDKIQDRLFATRLQASSIDGLSIPPIRAQYIVQYKNGLIGKHFKTLQQLGVFHLHEGLCSELILDLWKATGELGAMLWFHTIKNMDLYLYQHGTLQADLTVLIANLLDVWSVIDPSRILFKSKLHIIVHLVDAIRRFGPAVLYSTEIFECWNAIFRLCSVLSNHHAPSLDIGITLADMERFKHQISGGWWKNTAGSFVRGGEHVRSFLRQNPMLQRRLGWVEPSKLIAGTVKLCSKPKQNPTKWKDILADLTTPQLLGHHPDLIWHHCHHVVSRSMDICRSGSWIFFQGTAENSIDCGRIFKILAPAADTPATGSASPDPVVVVERFLLQNTNDERLNMPILTRILGDTATCIARPDAILFLFNAQHDCAHGKCGPTGVRNVRQERILTSRQEKYIVHTDDSRFFLNMHALHNADIIRETLPRSQTKPIPYFADRKSEHARSAAALRVTGPAKRAASAAKSAATRLRSKELREGVAAAGRAEETVPVNIS